MDCFEIVYSVQLPLRGMSRKYLSLCVRWTAWCCWDGWLIFVLSLSHQLMCQILKMLRSLTESCLEKAICFCTLAVQEGPHGQQVAWLPHAALCTQLWGEEAISAPKRPRSVVINVVGSCNICVLGIGRNLTSETEGLPGEGEKKTHPKLHSSLLWFYTCVLIGASYLSLLASLNTCALSPSSVWTDWEQERGSGGKEVPACLRKASKMDLHTGRKAGTETALESGQREIQEIRIMLIGMKNPRVAFFWDWELWRGCTLLCVGTWKDEVFGKSCVFFLLPFCYSVTSG